MNSMQLECARRDAANPGIATGTLRKHIGDLLAHIRELEAERLTHGNIMGRIAIALFSDQNNRTDEECVAAVAELSYERSGAIKRAERAEAERDALRALLREARERETRYVLPLYRDANYTARIDAALAGEKP